MAPENGGPTQVEPTTDHMAAGSEQPVLGSRETAATSESAGNELDEAARQREVAAAEKAAAIASNADGISSVPGVGETTLPQPETPPLLTPDQSVTAPEVFASPVDAIAAPEQPVEVPTNNAAILAPDSIVKALDGIQASRAADTASRQQAAAELRGQIAASRPPEIAVTASDDVAPPVADQAPAEVNAPAEAAAPNWSQPDAGAADHQARLDASRQAYLQNPGAKDAPESLDVVQRRADHYNTSQGLPTSAERAAALAPTKPTGLVGRIRSLFGR